MRACWGKSALKLALPASALSWAAKPALADSQAAPADDAVEASISDSSDGSFGGAQSMSEPYMHFGLRTSMPIGSSVTVGLRVVNNIIIVDQHGNNTARTRGNRHLYDTVLLLTPTEKVSAYVSYDYGQQHSINSGINHRDGIAGAAHWQFARRFAASVRAEWYKDASGFPTGVVQKLHEVTVSGEDKIIDGMLARAEYRRDGSDVPYFDHGLQSAGPRHNLRPRCRL